MNNVATISRPQLAVLCALHTLLGCATVEDIGTYLEATSRYTRATGTYIVEELVALGHCWREGNMIGLTSDMCAYLETNEYV
jgi:hypothetical protein